MVSTVNDKWGLCVSGELKGKGHCACGDSNPSRGVDMHGVEPLGCVCFGDSERGTEFLRWIWGAQGSDEN